MVRTEEKKGDDSSKGAGSEEGTPETSKEKAANGTSGRPEQPKQPDGNGRESSGLKGEEVLQRVEQMILNALDQRAPNLKEGQRRQTFETIKENLYDSKPAKEAKELGAYVETLKNYDVNNNADNTENNELIAEFQQFDEVPTSSRGNSCFFYALAEAGGLNINNADLDGTIAYIRTIMDAADIERKGRQLDPSDSELKDLLKSNNLINNNFTNLLVYVINNDNTPLFKWPLLGNEECDNPVRICYRGNGDGGHFTTLKKKPENSTTSTN